MIKIYKSIASFLFVSIFLLTSSNVTVFANKDSEQHEYNRLYYLYNIFIQTFSSSGGVSPYYYNEEEMNECAHNAIVVLRDPQADEAQYRNAADSILDFVYHKQYIDYDYAYSTCLNAMQEQNDGNWYGREEWNEFQNSISGLSNLLEEYKSDFYNYNNNGRHAKEITEAFHLLLRSYNEMTNKDNLPGDVDGNRVVNINDVTLIQRYLANMVDFNGAQKMSAMQSGLRGDVDDYNRASDVQINDATLLQKYLAEFKVSIPENNEHPVFVSEIKAFNSMESYRYLTERVFNFQICPRFLIDDLDSPIGNGFWCTELFIRNCQSWGYEENIYI